MKNTSLQRHCFNVCTVLLALILPVTPYVWAQQESSTPAAVRSARGVPRSECFPLETLPAPLRPKAEALLLRLLDSEALYTVVGGIKPMSSGYTTYRIKVAAPDMAQIEEVQRILSTFRCGNALKADLLPFHRTNGGTRYFEAVIFSKTTTAQMVTTYADFFSPYGITTASDPFGIALIIENDPTTARNRGLGYLYGYPKYAVDFFVAGADQYGETKATTPRDFIQLPTFVSPTGRFVYAVPKGHKENDEDRTLREKVTRIYNAYRERRARYIGAGKPGVVALLRDWLDDGTGRCALENARY